MRRKYKINTQYEELKIEILKAILFLKQSKNLNATVKDKINELEKIKFLDSKEKVQYLGDRQDFIECFVPDSFLLK